MTKRKLVVGIMGRGEGASRTDVRLAVQLGEAVARAGWIVLTGGRNAGVMAAANRGAKRVSGSLTLGILPSSERTGVSRDVDIAVFTGMGDARNAINVLSSDVVVICGELGSGTASEAALAIKAKRPLILLGADLAALALFKRLDPDAYVANTADQVIARIRMHVVY